MLPNLTPVMLWDGLRSITMRIPHTMFGHFYDSWRSNGYELAVAQADGDHDLVTFRRTPAPPAERVVPLVGGGGEATLPLTRSATVLEPRGIGR